MRHPSTVVGVAAILLLAIPVLTTDAGARWGGGGGHGARGGGGMGGRAGAPAVRSFGGPRMGGSGIRSFSAPRMGGGAGIRSFSGPRMGGPGARSFSGHRFGGSKVRSVSTPRMGGSNGHRFSGGSNVGSTRTLRGHPAAGSGRFAGSSARRALRASRRDSATGPSATPHSAPRSNGGPDSAANFITTPTGIHIGRGGAPES
jgi:hypothetical protein